MHYLLTEYTPSMIVEAGAVVAVVSLLDGMEVITYYATLMR